MTMIRADIALESIFVGAITMLIFGALSFLFLLLCFITLFFSFGHNAFIPLTDVWLRVRVTLTPAFRQVRL